MKKLRIKPASLVTAIITLTTVMMTFMTVVVLWIYGSSPPGGIFIESRESKTAEQKKVFNRILYQSQIGQDVWMMQQSHHGAFANAAAWDRLAIVVDKTKKPYVSHFYQLEPGALVWDPHAKQVPFSVSCFICHSNGPRAIRPNFYSDQARISIVDRLRLLAWNLRIKTYPRIEGPRTRDFRYPGGFANQTLQIQTCVHCHQDSGLIARGFLTRQNSATIRFMIDQGEMPPFPFSLSKSDSMLVHAFSDGI